MKKQILSISCLALLFFSCSKKNNNAETNSLSKKDFEIIGIKHNEGLERVYLALKESGSKYRRNQVIFDLHENNIITHSIQNSYKTLAHNESIAYLNYLSTTDYMHPDAYSFNVNLIDNVFFNGYQVTGNNQLFNSSVENNLSFTEISYLESLNSILSTNDTSLTSILSQINSLEEQADNNLTDFEKKSVLTATSIARYTLVYWKDNIENWLNLLYGENETSLTNIRTDNGIRVNHTPRTYAGYWLWGKIKKYGKKDIAGAVEAGVTLRIAAFAGPIGWKAYALGIAGGAAGTSVAALFD